MNFVYTVVQFMNQMHQPRIGFSAIFFLFFFLKNIFYSRVVTLFRFKIGMKLCRPLSEMFPVLWYVYIPIYLFKKSIIKEQ